LWGVHACPLIFKYSFARRENALEIANFRVFVRKCMGKYRENR
jgi:hypothetical protein